MLEICLFIVSTQNIGMFADSLMCHVLLLPRQTQPFARSATLIAIARSRKIAEHSVCKILIGDISGAKNAQNLGAKNAQRLVQNNCFEDLPG